MSYAYVDTMIGFRVGMSEVYNMYKRQAYLAAHLSGFQKFHNRHRHILPQNNVFLNNILKLRTILAIVTDLICNLGHLAKPYQSLL